MIYTLHRFIIFHETTKLERNFIDSSNIIKYSQDLNCKSVSKYVVRTSESTTQFTKLVKFIETVPVRH